MDNFLEQIYELPFEDLSTETEMVGFFLTSTANAP